MENSAIKPVCGVVMPISAIDGCSETHWTEVFNILSDSIERAGFQANLVSNADDVGVIQKRIVQNLYDNPIVICDVSAKNPNVMFELGMRLAFDKPTIIIKDDATSYSFDTTPIEHLVYPRDLRYGKMISFKDTLSKKLQSTHQRSTTDPQYTTFLKSFGDFNIATIEQKEVSTYDLILSELQRIETVVAKLDQKVTSTIDVNGILNSTLARGILNYDPALLAQTRNSDLIKKGALDRLAQEAIKKMKNSERDDGLFE